MAPPPIDTSFSDVEYPNYEEEMTPRGRHRLKKWTAEEDRYMVLLIQQVSDQSILEGLRLDTPVV